MKILHVNRDDTEGGAARAALRLCRAQRKNGIDSNIFVQNKNSQEKYVIKTKEDGLLPNYIKTFISRRIVSMQRSCGNNGLHSINIFNNARVIKYINESDADIVNLHWLCWEMMSVEDIGKIKKKIIWTLHDMWPFSGGEHYDDDVYPGRYTGAYTSKNKLANTRGIDLNKYVWERKIKNWIGLDMCFVAPSRWMANCARNSAIGRGFPVRVVPNCIDTNLFRPIEKNTIRSDMNIPEDNIVILFGAMSSTSDRRKGFHLMQGAFEFLLSRLSNKKNITILIYGGDSDIKIPGFDVRSFGYVNDDALLVKLYNAANLMLVPSLQENLSNAIMESIACGTPVCCFKIGGNSDMVIDGVTGYICENVNSEEYAETILRGLNNAKNSGMRSNCVEYVMNNFSEAVVVNKYTEVYNEKLQGRSDV